MKNKLFYLMTFSILFYVIGCSKEQESKSGVALQDQTFFTPANEPVFLSEHDQMINAFTKALSEAVRAHSGMREMIQKESFRRFDGDFNFLVSDALDKPIRLNENSVITKGGNGIDSFANLLREYISVETKADGDLLQTLQVLYPDLQVAIPIHAEEWNPEEYTPVVAFLPDSYDDQVTATIPGYDAEGNYVEVDAINAPDVPVIVVSHNERIHQAGLEEPDTTDNPGDLLIPDPPTSLTATISDVSVILSWQYNDVCSGFSIWRQGPSDSNFQELARVAATDRGYFDNSISAGTSYQYYVTAYNVTNHLWHSFPSNTVTIQAPAALAPLSNFSVYPSGTNLQFTWSSNDSTNSDVVIKEKGPYDSDYSQIGVQTAYTSYYLYTPSERGKRHDYLAYRQNTVGQSGALFSFIYPPFRNSNLISKTYARRLSVTNNMDGWAQGDPEFFLEIFGLNSAGSVDKIGRIWMNFTDGYKDKSEEFTFKNIYDWVILNPATQWYSNIMLWLFEDDGGQPRSINATFGISAEIAELLGITGSVSYSFQVEDGDDDCGSTMLYYFDDPEQTLHFPNFGAQLRISESGNGNIN